MRIRLFHVTTSKAAESILRSGFTDQTCFISDDPVTGVFVSALPLPKTQGPKGGCVLEIVIESTPSQMFYEWELVEESKPYRGWCIPASVLNDGKTRLLTAEERPCFGSSEFWDEYPPGEPEKMFAELRADGELEGLNDW